jgi:hypothetical protein
METMKASTILDWYLGFLHYMLHVDGGVPMWTDIRLTESVRYGADQLPCEVGRTFTVEEYRARFTQLCSAGWSWINLEAVGLLHGVLLLHVQPPPRAPEGTPWTSVNMKGPMTALKQRNYALDGLVPESEPAAG